MGTPGFAVPALDALYKAGYTIAAVYTQPPRPAGRGQKETPSPVHHYATMHHLPVFTPVSLKSPDVQAEFAAHRADVAVVAAYGLLLPHAILSACPRGCINIHPSLLPRWRGAAPLQRTLMAGDTETGVTIMQMDKGLDTGDMLLVRHFPIPADMDAGGLHDTLSTMGAQMVLEVLAASPSPVPQPQNGVTYAAKITPAECRIDWNQPASAITHHIRGLSPSPGASFKYGDEIIKIFAAKPVSIPHYAAPGSVLDDTLSIACKEGVLQPLILQRPGKKRLPIAEFLKGFSLPGGTVVA